MARYSLRNVVDDEPTNVAPHYQLSTNSHRPHWHTTAPLYPQHPQPCIQTGNEIVVVVHSSIFGSQQVHLILFKTSHSARHVLPKLSYISRCDGKAHRLL